MSNLTDEIKRWYKSGNIITQLILINVAVYLLFLVLGIIGGITQTNLKTFQIWLAAPSDLIELIFKPWSIFTYMFVHSGFWHLAGNMIFLYFFGPIFLTFFSRKQFLSIYFLGGLVGYALFALSYNIFPGLSNQVGVPIVGASAAIMAIMAATITYSPNYRVRLMFIPFDIRILWIGLVFFIKDLRALEGGINSGGIISHIGGIILGYIAISQLQKGRDITAWFSRLMDSFIALFKPKSNLKVKYKKSEGNFSNRPKTDEEYNSEKADRQANIDAILDKIKRSGYDSLSKKEKDYLFNESKKL